MGFTNMHPRRRLQEPLLASECLPSALTYSGTMSSEHVRDLAAFTALIAQNDWPSFERAYALVRDNGYSIATTDVPDTPDVPVGAHAGFISWVKQNVHHSAAFGLLGVDWFA